MQPYTDIELPMTVPGGLDDIRFTDRDAILVREGLSSSEPRSGLYATNLSLEVAGGLTLNVLRGWTTVDATVNGVTLHFWNTHLETQEEGPEIQVAQGRELLLRVQDDDLPLVAVGDFNSAADGTTTPDVLEPARGRSRRRLDSRGGVRSGLHVLSGVGLDECHVAPGPAPRPDLLPLPRQSPLCGPPRGRPGRPHTQRPLAVGPCRRRRDSSSPRTRVGPTTRGWRSRCL